MSFEQLSPPAARDNQCCAFRQQEKRQIFRGSYIEYDHVTDMFIPMGHPFIDRCPEDNLSPQCEPRAA